MHAAWLRKQSGQAVVIVAVAVLVLAGSLALALDGGSIYLDKRQLQNAADSAALAGAEKLMAVPPSYTVMHDQAVGNLLQNLPGTTTAGTTCSPSCPPQKTIGLPGGTGVGTLDLGAGYHVELSAPTSYTYQVTVWHTHPVVVAPVHGFQPTVTIAARATAQNANLPYAVVLLQDKPQYSTDSNFNINGTPGGSPVQCPGRYSNQIMVQNGATALLYPGVYQVQANGVDVQGTLRTLSSQADLPIACPGLPPLNTWGTFDPGVIIEVTPANASGSTQCNKHIFAAEANSNITLAPSPKYFNISLYVETMPGWQTVCTTQPLGTNGVRFPG